MEQKEYKEKLHSFRTSCRIYRQEKLALETSSGSADPVLIRFIEEDVKYVEKVFSIIKDKFGASAALLVWTLYVEEKTQQAAAFQFGITRRQLQYAVSEYMHHVFEEEQSHAH